MAILIGYDTAPLAGAPVALPRAKRVDIVVHDARS
jgi:hypothetical protein